MKSPSAYQVSKSRNSPRSIFFWALQDSAPLEVLASSVFHPVMGGWQKWAVEAPCKSKFGDWRDGAPSSTSDVTDFVWSIDVLKLCVPYELNELPGAAPYPAQGRDLLVSVCHGVLGEGHVGDVGGPGVPPVDEGGSALLVPLDADTNTFPPDSAEWTG